MFFFKRELSGRLNTLFLGFASGVMVAASVWSLLIPAIDGAEETYGAWSLVPAVAGFLLGGAFLVAIDKLIPHLHQGTGEEEGPPSHLKKPAKLFFAVTIHNIPEGLAVGFAFGAAARRRRAGRSCVRFGPRDRHGHSKFPGRGRCSSAHAGGHGAAASKPFSYGAGSGAVEPVFAVVGYFLAANLAAAQPWFLAFAAGRDDLCRRRRPHPRSASLRASRTSVRGARWSALP